MSSDLRELRPEPEWPPRAAPVRMSSPPKPVSVSQVDSGVTGQVRKPTPRPAAQRRPVPRVVLRKPIEEPQPTVTTSTLVTATLSAVLILSGIALGNKIPSIGQRPVSVAQAEVTEFDNATGLFGEGPAVVKAGESLPKSPPTTAVVAPSASQPEPVAAPAVAELASASTPEKKKSYVEQTKDFWKQWSSSARSSLEF